MATIYDLKPKFQALLRPIVRALADAHVTANQVTIAAFALSVLLGIGLALNPGAPLFLFAMPIFLFIRMAMNAIDGILAREFNQQSNFGAIVNEITDVLSDAALYLPLALIAGVDPTLIVILVTLAIAGEMTGVLGAMVGASRRYDGPFGKSDRAFFFGALALIIALGVSPGAWTTIILGVAIVLALLTIANRARAALKETGDG